VTGYGVAGRYFDCEQWRITPNPALKLWRGLLHATGPDFGSPNGVALDCEKMASVLDGTSNSFAIGEWATIYSIQPNYPNDPSNRGSFWAYAYTSYSLSGFTWREPRTFLPDYNLCGQIGGGDGNNPCKRAFGSLHPGGAQFGLVDGSVRFISQTTDMDLLCYLSSIAGGSGEPAAQMP
jgi:prepilin-type processing-associated H-X9-DG protein